MRTTIQLNWHLMCKQLSTAAGEMVTVVSHQRPDSTRYRCIPAPPNRQQAVIEALQSRSNASQQSISAALSADISRGRVSNVIPFWIFNGMSVTATADVIQELAARSDVESITSDTTEIIPVGTVDLAPPAGNLSAINAPALWDLGYSGQGVVVANMDTGVDVSHPELAARWRGGSDSWYDPYNQHPTTPTDISGHGTWTMGVMVAGDGSGTTLGVAPQAQWIAVKIFNDSGSATATAIHLGFSGFSIGC
jgi:subtilisin family serine protease